MASANFPPSFTHGEDEEADVRRGHEVGRKGREYRLIEDEDKEMGRRCISTGPSPLDLGIVAMA